MKPFVHGLAVLLIPAAVLLGNAALAQDKTMLTTDREKASYVIGYDIVKSIGPVEDDVDLPAFEKALTNSLEGGAPLLTHEEAKVVSTAVMERAASRAGRAAAGAKVPDVAKDKAGLLVGADVGRSLLPIKDEIDLPVLLQSVRTSMAKSPLLMDDAEMNTVRKDFGMRVQEKLQAKAKAAGEANLVESAKFLAENKQVKGVFTTPSGLQYMVLRQGNGERPKPSSRVRVHYEGKLLDGTVFDSSYARNEPAEFGLSQVIAGWTEGVAMMPTGAKYRFWIPGDLAYGARGAPGSIGPNATLTFDVELLAIIEP